MKKRKEKKMKNEKNIYEKILREKIKVEEKRVSVKRESEPANSTWIKGNITSMPPSHDFHLDRSWAFGR